MFLPRRVLSQRADDHGGQGKQTRTSGIGPTPLFTLWQSARLRGDPPSYYTRAACTLSKFSEDSFCIQARRLRFVGAGQGPRSQYSECKDSDGKHVRIRSGWVLIHGQFGFLRWARAEMLPGSKRILQAGAGPACDEVALNWAGVAALSSWAGVLVVLDHQRCRGSGWRCS